MKVVILAGGLGTRISEETQLKPKPMVEIGGKPILWHIMKIYSQQGFNDFIICCGYKGYVIKEYFANYHLHNSNVTFDFSNNSVTYSSNKTEPWNVSLIDTGDSSMTGGRLLAIKDYISANENFHFTYGDGVADIDLHKLIQSHRSSSCLATVTAVQQPGRFGALEISESNRVSKFVEKPLISRNYINGGFFILSPKVLELIQNSHTVWEDEPLKILSSKNQLNAYKHSGFWQPMDTLRDKVYLDNLIQDKTAPWMKW